MIINDVSLPAETATQLEEQFFSIQDQGMIFDILRNKMYSNPILAICREISCNARDAHREIGKSEIPIVIYLPNSQEPFFKVKDYGPGISPDRMSNIFIKYTASTKRNDNIQTGGFGLGAKTPFSYSDSFNIVTIYNGTKYNYACFIDESKVGKLALLSSVSSSEPNGTEIIVPVQSKDFTLFQDYVEKSTRHWKVKPIIKPFNIVWKDPIPMMSGTNWCLDTNSNSWTRGTKLIVDEIEYPVDSSALRSYADSSLIDAARGDLYLYFGVGELSLSASREQIYLDEFTKNTISEKIKNVTQEIKNVIQNKLNNASNFFEANVYYRTALQKSFHNLGFLGKLQWQDHELIFNHPDIGCTLVSFSKGKNYSKRYNYRDINPDKISRSTHRSFIFSGEENTNEIYINDLEISNLTNKHVKKAFENNPNLKCVQVVCPNDKVTIQTLNDTYHLDKMNPKLLSSITKAQARSQSNNTRLIVSKFDLIANCFKQTSYSSISEDNNLKVLVFLKKDSLGNKEVHLESGKYFDMKYLRIFAADNSGHSFYAVDSSINSKRINEDFSNFIMLDSFIEDQISKFERDEFILMRHIQQSRSDLNLILINNKQAFMQEIQDSHSTFLNHVIINNKIHEALMADRSRFHSSRIYRELYEYFNSEITQEEIDSWLSKNDQFDIKKSSIEVEKKYPLLHYVFNCHDGSICSEHIFQYVNLIDTSLE